MAASVMKLSSMAVGKVEFNRAQAWYLTHGPDNKHYSENKVFEDGQTQAHIWVTPNFFRKMSFGSWGYFNNSFLYTAISLLILSLTYYFTTQVGTDCGYSGQNKAATAYEMEYMANLPDFCADPVAPALARKNNLNFAAGLANEPVCQYSMQLAQPIATSFDFYTQMNTATDKAPSNVFAPSGARGVGAGAMLQFSAEMSDRQYQDFSQLNTQPVQNRDYDATGAIAYVGGPDQALFITNVYFKMGTDIAFWAVSLLCTLLVYTLTRKHTFDFRMAGDSLVVISWALVVCFWTNYASLEGPVASCEYKLIYHRCYNTGLASVPTSGGGSKLTPGDDWSDRTDSCLKQANNAYYMPLGAIESPSSLGAFKAAIPLQTSQDEGLTGAQFRELSIPLIPCFIAWYFVWRALAQLNGKAMLPPILCNPFTTSGRNKAKRNLYGCEVFWCRWMQYSLPVKIKGDSAAVGGGDGKFSTGDGFYSYLSYLYGFLYGWLLVLLISGLGSIHAFHYILKSNGAQGKSIVGDYDLDLTGIEDNLTGISVIWGTVAVLMVSLSVFLFK